MKINPSFEIILILFVFALTACDAKLGSSTNTEAGNHPPETFSSKLDPFSKDGRLFTIGHGKTSSEDWQTVFNLVRDIGVDFVPLTISWDQYETAPYEYEPESNNLAFANSFYSSENMPLLLTINTIDNSNLRLPEDLREKPFNDPEVITRFNAFVDWVFTQIPDLELLALVIGNEIDIYLGEDDIRWEQHRLFFETASTHVRDKKDALIVGTKITFNGLIKNTPEHSLEINKLTDVVMTTYYPIANDHLVREPSVVLDDFETVTNAYLDREIYFLEIGYPTSALLGSSEKKQAEFVKYFFTAWDAHADQITVVNYSMLTDIPPDMIASFLAYYGFFNVRIGAYIGSLGLREYKGAGGEKPAYDVFLQEIQTRGW